MIRINKGSSPSELNQYKRECADSIARGTTKLLDDFHQKDELRKKLAEEQGFLCAYCMQRIAPERGNTKIEHFKAQKAYPEEQLDYSNLLICCNGNEGADQKNQHCDTRKGNSEIKYNPASHPSIDRTVSYKRDGTIFSDDGEWDNQLNDRLNLNIPRIRSNRQSAMKAVDQILSGKSGTRKKAEIESYIERWRIINSSGHLKEYCGAVIHRLQKHPAYRRG